MLFFDAVWRVHVLLCPVEGGKHSAEARQLGWITVNKTPHTWHNTSD